MFSLICFENILYAYRIFTKIKNHVLDHKVNNVDTVEILLPPFSDRKVIKLEIIIFILCLLIQFYLI